MEKKKIKEAAVKKFFCLWGHWGRGERSPNSSMRSSYPIRSEILTGEYFTPKNKFCGYYSREETERILLLNVGAQLDFGNHIILRLPDEYIEQKHHNRWGKVEDVSSETTINSLSKTNKQHE